MKENLIYGLAKIALGKDGEVKATKKYQSFADIDEGLVVINMCKDATDKSFIDHIINSHKFSRANEISPLIWTALHEIGHIKTDDFVEDNPEMRATLETLYEFGADINKLNKMWYELPDEWEATEWAINFVKNHFLLCKLLS